MPVVSPLFGGGLPGAGPFRFHRLRKSAGFRQRPEPVLTGKSLSILRGRFPLTLRRPAFFLPPSARPHESCRSPFQTVRPPLCSIPPYGSRAVAAGFLLHGFHATLRGARKTVQSCHAYKEYPWRGPCNPVRGESESSALENSPGWPLGPSLSG